MADVLAIDGATIDLVATNTSVDTLRAHTRGGTPELHFSRLLGSLAALPDAWSGKSVTFTMGATLVFAGDVVGYCDGYLPDWGWIREYRAMGLVHRAAYIPLTDSVTLTDTSVWDLQADSPNFTGAKAGRTVGEIVEAILEMEANATALSNAGIGGYTSLGPPTLPALTLADLATLTVIPPWQVTVSGERILQSLESFVQSAHPNHYLHVQPDGVIRFLDPRTFPTDTLTLGSDSRLGLPSLTRDYADCYPQILIRGNSRVEGVTVETAVRPGSSASDGGLAEDFAWGVKTNAQAKTDWTPACWNQPLQNGQANEAGAATCPDTLHVTCSVAGTYVANYWDQTDTGVLGVIELFADSLGGMISQQLSRRVVASTATSGGTITVTLDYPLPATDFNSYRLWGLTANCNLVGRKYRVTNPAIAAAMQNYFPYPMPLRNAVGSGATMVSTPLAQVIYNNQSASDGVTLDPVSGHVYLDKPAQTYYGNPQWPDNVQVFLAVATGTLEAWAPSSSSYAGTVYTVEGIRRTKIITVLDWRDYSNQASMDTFAAEMLDAVKDVVVEGSIPYHGLLSTYLSPGRSVSIAGNGYTTGWESLSLPITSVDVRFNNGPTGTSYDMVLHMSNRRAKYSPSNFLRPNIVGMEIGSGAGGFVEVRAPQPPMTGITPEMLGLDKSAMELAEGMGLDFTPMAAPEYRERGPQGLRGVTTTAAERDAAASMREDQDAARAMAVEQGVGEDNARRAAPLAVGPERDTTLRYGQDQGGVDIGGADVVAARPRPAPRRMPRRSRMRLQGREPGDLEGEGGGGMGE